MHLSHNSEYQTHSCLAFVKIEKKTEEESCRPDYLAKFPVEEMIFECYDECCKNCINADSTAAFRIEPQWKDERVIWNF